MEFSEEDIQIESLTLENADIVLSSPAVICGVCKTGKVVTVGRETQLVIYTRTGTKRGLHVEKRCNNRTLPCRVGHFYGYTKVGSVKHMNDDVLNNDFLITSTQTAFEVMYLWDMTPQILFSL